jgi:hypothetical protein
LAEIKSFPNNQDVYVGAEWVMKWLHGRTSGVFGADGNLATSVVPHSMSIEISDGIGWMSNENGDGVVFWNDSEQTSGSKLMLTHEVADSALDRIDRVVVTWETTNYVALPTISILKGVASSNPKPPSLTNNNVQRQISIRQQRIPAGAISLSASYGTDERLNPNVCGIVTESVKIDTSTMQSQFEALLKSIQNELLDLESGTGVELKKLQFNSVSVAVSKFVSNTTYEDYPFRAAVTLEGVQSTMIPEVIFSMADAIGGNFAPVAESYNGGVYLYAADKPEKTTVIPTIICWKGNA